MYARDSAAKILKTINDYSVIAIVGPRQSGKTTLSKMLFPEFNYVLLEDLSIKEFANSDPKGFFNKYKGSLILDEVQKAPDLLQYIQQMVDTPGNKRKFILSSSEHLLLSEKISQSLAGRVRIFNLLPLSYNELKEVSSFNLEEMIFKGAYPKIYHQNLDSQEWLSQYYQTYVQKDVREIINISNLDNFDRFIRLCAGRIGQLLDYSSISSDCGLSSPTIKSWLSVLKATFICFTLEPHFKNFNKRIIKSPKLYFYDTGLLCYLLRIKDSSQLNDHPLFGYLYENWIISEFIKSRFNSGSENDSYFWRSQKGHEVDLVIDEGVRLYPIEIKSSMTFNQEFIKNLEYLNKLQENTKNINPGTCVYRGEESFTFKNYKINSWKDFLADL
jgi:predicted AAA+ superfamily ATPase